jgi:hypothetical protein
MRQGYWLIAPSTCYDPYDLVEIVVHSTLREDDTKTYSIPRGLLKWHSSYFAAALDPVNRATFQGNAMGQLELHESIAVFDAFHCWLYTGRLKDVSLRDDDTPSDDLYLDTYTMFRTWAFADMRGIPDLPLNEYLVHRRSCN